MSNQSSRALEQAGREVIDKSYDPATWALALASAEGVEDQARANYIKLRVPILAQAYEIEERQIAEERARQRMVDEAKFRNEQSARKRSEAFQAQRAVERSEKYRAAGQQFRSFLRKLGL